MYTTLNRIREHSPCTDGWETLLKYLGKTKPDDEPLPLLTILNSNGFDHTLWCFRVVDGFEKEKLLLGITFAREVAHLMPAESKKALDVLERYANGSATEKEFEVARRAAADAADAVWDADTAAADVADVVWDADTAASYAAEAARTAAARAACSADAARAAAARAAAARAGWEADVAAAWAVAYSTIRAKQEAQLMELLERTK